MAKCDVADCQNRTRSPYAQCWFHRKCIVAGCGKRVGPRDCYCSMHRARLVRRKSLDRLRQGRHLGSNGYMVVWIAGVGQRYEHRIVAEKMLGRKLMGWESVHHKDKNKLNNSPDNLEIVESSVHMTRHNSWARSRKHILSEVRRCADEIGQTPNYRLFTKWLGPGRNYKPIKRLFGSWSALLLASRLPLNWAQRRALSRV